MVAFVILAAYGFYLIYRLTHDISTLSQSVTRMAVIVSDAMPQMSNNLNEITVSMDNMDGSVKDMNHNIDGMNRSVYGMQRDMNGMNRTVSSGPFGMMNDFMPFSSNTNVPPPMPPPRRWQQRPRVSPYNKPAVQNRPYTQQNYKLTKPALKPEEKKANDSAKVHRPTNVPLTLKEQLVKEKKELETNKKFNIKEPAIKKRTLEPQTEKSNLDGEKVVTAKETNIASEKSITAQKNGYQTDSEIQLDDSFFDDILPENY
jgi:hypothetical protein